MFWALIADEKASALTFAVAGLARVQAHCQETQSLPRSGSLLGNELGEIVKELWIGF